VLTGDFVRHVFEIAALVRVPHSPYNYRVWVVGMVWFELVAPTQSYRTASLPPAPALSQPRKIWWWTFSRRHDLTFTTFFRRLV